MCSGSEGLTIFELVNGSAYDQDTRLANTELIVETALHQKLSELGTSLYGLIVPIYLFHFLLMPAFGVPAHP